jgi:hypothetical protein
MQKCSINIVRIIVHAIFNIKRKHYTDIISLDKSSMTAAKYITLLQNKLYSQIFPILYIPAIKKITPPWQIKYPERIILEIISQYQQK